MNAFRLIISWIVTDSSQIKSRWRLEWNTSGAHLVRENCEHESVNIWVNFRSWHTYLACCARVFYGSVDNFLCVSFAYITSTLGMRAPERRIPELVSTEMALNASECCLRFPWSASFIPINGLQTARLPEWQKSGEISILSRVQHLRQTGSDADICVQRNISPRAHPIAIFNAHFYFVVCK